MTVGHDNSTINIELSIIRLIHMSQKSIEEVATCHKEVAVVDHVTGSH